MKTNTYFKTMFEEKTQTYLPRKTYTIIRLDGKAFHTFTRGMKKPFDENIYNAMDETAKRLCEEIQGCRLGYTQSDEISLLLTDFETEETDAWFGNNLQKIVSISASLATGYFNQILEYHKIAFFDSRSFTISGLEDVMDYFIWRQDDCYRNSVQGLAQTLYSHKELNKKNIKEQMEMIFDKGINWNDCNTREKRGGLVYKEHKGKSTPDGIEFFRGEWVIKAAPDFRKSNFLYKNLPKRPKT